MKLEVQQLSNKLEALIKSNPVMFEYVASLKNMMGVYCIYEGDKLIYIGKTNKFHIRFGTDLKHESTHTLVRKLLKTEKFKERMEVVNYLKNKCRYKISFCESNRECEALESLAIFILNPELNHF
jgi:hypothetical protein